MITFVFSHFLILYYKYVEIIEFVSLSTHGTNYVSVWVRGECWEKAG